MADSGSYNALAVSSLSRFRHPLDGEKLKSVRRPQTAGLSIAGGWTTHDSHHMGSNGGMPEQKVPARYMYQR